MIIKHIYFPHSSVGQESACSAGDPGSVPGSRRSSGEGTGKPLQYSGLENLMDGGAWQATINGSARVRHNLVIKPPQKIFGDGISDREGEKINNLGR